VIVPFCGEYLFHPVPLELSFGDCGYGCAYCFVRLNGSRVRHSAVGLANALGRARGRGDLTSVLLDDGYPVLVSNRSDFLSPRAWDGAARRGLAVMTEMGVRCAFQTKGGTRGRLEEAEGTLDYKAVWYWTLTTLDEGLSARLEPGAPGPAERLRCMEWLAGRGHSVYAGFNPYERTWHGGRGAEMARRAREAGAFGVLMQCLHLNSNQRKRMTAGEVGACGADAVGRAMRKRMCEGDLDYADSLMGACAAEGLPFFCYLGDGGTVLFDRYREVYGKVFPTIQDAGNRLAEGAGDERIVGFGGFWDALTARESPPRWGGDMRDYVASLNREMLYDQALSTRGIGFRGVARLMWRDLRMKAGPMFRREWAMLVGDDYLPVADADGDPLYLWRRRGGLPTVIPLGRLSEYSALSPETA
jgi:hypothetical protein